MKLRSEYIRMKSKSETRKEVAPAETSLEQIYFSMKQRRIVDVFAGFSDTVMTTDRGETIACGSMGDPTTYNEGMPILPNFDPISFAFGPMSVLALGRLRAPGQTASEEEMSDINT